MSAVGILLGRFDHDQALLARAAAPDGLVDRSISAFVREGAADAPAPADAEGYKIADPVRGFMEAELHELRARFRELLENYETVMLERSELHERTVALQARAATCDLLHCPSGGLTAGVRGSHVVVSYGKQSTDVFAEGAAKVEEGSEAIALETQRIKEGVVMETPDVLQVSPEVTSPAITKMLLMLQSDLAVAKVVIDSAPDNHTVIVDEKTGLGELHALRAQLEDTTEELMQHKEARLHLEARIEDLIAERASLIETASKEKASLRLALSVAEDSLHASAAQLQQLTEECGRLREESSRGVVSEDVEALREEVAEAGRAINALEDSAAETQEKYRASLMQLSENASQVTENMVVAARQVRALEAALEEERALSARLYEQVQRVRAAQQDEKAVADFDSLSNGGDRGTATDPALLSLQQAAADAISRAAQALELLQVMQKEKAVLLEDCSAREVASNSRCEELVRECGALREEANKAMLERTSTCTLERRDAELARLREECAALRNEVNDSRRAMGESEADAARLRGELGESRGKTEELEAAAVAAKEALDRALRERDVLAERSVGGERRCDELVRECAVLQQEVKEKVRILGVSEGEAARLHGERTVLQEAAAVRERVLSECEAEAVRLRDALLIREGESGVLRGRGEMLEAAVAEAKAASASALGERDALLARAAESERRCEDLKRECDVLQDAEKTCADEMVSLRSEFLAREIELGVLRGKADVVEAAARDAKESVKNLQLEKYALTERAVVAEARCDELARACDVLREELKVATSEKARVLSECVADAERLRCELLVSEGEMGLLRGKCEALEAAASETKAVLANALRERDALCERAVGSELRCDQLVRECDVLREEAKETARVLAESEAEVRRLCGDALSREGEVAALREKHSALEAAAAEAKAGLSTAHCERDALTERAVGSERRCDELTHDWGVLRDAVAAAVLETGRLTSERAADVARLQGELLSCEGELGVLRGRGKAWEAAASDAKAALASAVEERDALSVRAMVSDKHNADLVRECDELREEVKEKARLLGECEGETARLRGECGALREEATVRASMLSELEAEAARLRDELATLQGKGEVWDAAAQEAKEALAHASLARDALLERAVGSEQRCDELERECLAFREDINAVTSEKARVLSDRDAEVARLREVLLAREGEMSVLRGKCESMEAVATETKVALACALTERDALTERTVASETQCDGMARECSALREEVKEKVRVLSEAEAETALLRGECGEKVRLLGEYEVDVTRLRAELLLREGELGALRGKCEVLEAATIETKDVLAGVLRERADSVARAAASEARCDDLAREYDKLREEAKAAALEKARALGECEEEVARLQEVALLHESELGVLRGKMESLQSSVAAQPDAAGASSQQLSGALALVAAVQSERDAALVRVEKVSAERESLALEVVALQSKEQLLSASLVQLEERFVRATTELHGESARLAVSAARIASLEAELVTVKDASAAAQTRANDNMCQLAVATHETARLATELQLCRDTLSKLAADVTTLSAQNTALEEECGALREKAALLSDQATLLTSAKDKAEGELAQTRADMQARKAASEQAMKELEVEVEQLRSDNSRLSQLLLDSTAVAERTGQQLEAAQAEMASALQQFAELEAACVTLRSQLAEADMRSAALQQVVEEKASELSFQTGSVTALTKQLEEEQDYALQLSVKLADAVAARGILANSNEALEARITSVSADLERVTAQLDATAEELADRTCKEDEAQQEEEVAAAWHELELPRDAPPIATLDDPIVAPVLLHVEEAKRDALLRWMKAVASGGTVGRKCFDLERLPAEVTKGYQMLVLPFLAQRAAVSVQARDKKEVRTDLRLVLEGSPSARDDTASVGSKPRK